MERQDTIFSQSPPTNHWLTCSHTKNVSLSCRHLKKTFFFFIWRGMYAPQWDSFVNGPFVMSQKALDTPNTPTDVSFVSHPTVFFSSKHCFLPSITFSRELQPSIFAGGCKQRASCPVFSTPMDIFNARYHKAVTMTEKKIIELTPRWSPSRKRNGKAGAHCLWRSAVRRASIPPGHRRPCTAAPRGWGWAGAGGWAAARSGGRLTCGWGSRASCGALDSSGTTPAVRRRGWKRHICTQMCSYDNL